MSLSCPRLHFHRPVIQLITLFFGIGVLLLANSAFAASSRVTFIALINNQLALMPASWIIYKQDDRENPIATLERHSGTLALKSGRYVATVKMKKTTKSTNFRVESGVDSTITIAVE